mmetsp:Transcript_28044/g.90405  ORF Transcript_28044/g.90405 Transcript_28044/m.90405 type:complete len:831 (+) Transcript_28044:167-2659(+)
MKGETSRLVDGIHARYDGASTLALKPLCRKVCTVADIVEEELEKVKDADVLCEGLRTLETVVTLCGACPVEAKLLQRSYVAAAKRSTRLVGDALRGAAEDAADELADVANSFVAKKDMENRQDSKALCEQLVRAGVAADESEAAVEVRRFAEKKEFAFPLTDEDRTFLEGLRQQLASEPVSKRPSRRQRVGSIKPSSTLLSTIALGEDTASNEAPQNDDLDAAPSVSKKSKAAASARGAASCSSSHGGARKLPEDQRPVVPDQFRCPITLEIMSDPVFLFTQSGRSFEREALEHWLELHPTVDPLTNEEHGMLLEYAPNRVLKEVIALWCSENDVTLDDCRSPASASFGGGRTSHFNGGTTSAAAAATSSGEGALLGYPQNQATTYSGGGGGLGRGRGGDLDSQASEMEARYPGVGGKVHRLGLTHDEDTRGRAAAGLLKAMEESEHEEGEDVARMIADAGGVPFLVVLLAATSRAARESAAMALCRVARRPRDNRALIVNARGIAACVRLLTSADATDLTRQAAAGVLQHVACYSMQFKVAIANAGAIPLLVGLLADPNASDDTKADAARCLWSIAVNDQKKIAIANAGAIPHLVALVARRSGGEGSVSSVVERGGPLSTTSTIAVREAAAGALQNLAANNSDNKAAIILAGAVPPLVELLATSAVETARETAAGALQNLAKHNESNKSVLIEAGVLPPLIRTLGDDRASARSQRTSARAIENLVWSSNDVNKKAVVDAGAVPVLCAKVLDADADAEVRQASAEALKVLANTPKLRTKVARHLGQNWAIMSPSERDVENLINASLRRSSTSQRGAAPGASPAGGTFHHS